MSASPPDNSNRAPATVAFFRQVLETMPSALIVVDEDGCIVLVNHRCEQIFGYARSDLLGRRLEMLLPERYRDAHCLLRKAFAQEPRNRSMGLGNELFGLHRDGSEFPVEIGLSPVNSDNGDLMVANVVDVTERKRGEAEARVKADALARSRVELEAHKRYEQTLSRQADELKLANAALEKVRQDLFLQAKYDHLTGLANRSLFEDFLKRAMARAKRGKRGLALLFLDLDHFKAINDRLGHAAGDRLLHSFATRLAKCVREGDLAARMSGDEFAVILDEVSEASTAEQVARNILQSMRRPHNVGGEEIAVGTSIGVAIYPEDGTDPGALVSAADAAMYEAKRQGRGGSVLAR